MKGLTILSALAAAVGLCFVAYGAWGPYYPTMPLKAPISFRSGAPQEFPFRLQSSFAHIITLGVRRPPDPEQLFPLLGDFDHQRSGTLDITWEVLADGRLVAQGSSRDRSYIPMIAPSGTRDVTIDFGSFNPNKGAHYLLRVTPENHEPTWDAFSPYVAIVVERGVLAETLLSYWLLGIAMSFVSGIALLTCSVKLFRRSSRSRRIEVASGI